MNSENKTFESAEIKTIFRWKKPGKWQHLVTWNEIRYTTYLKKKNKIQDLENLELAKIICWRTVIEEEFSAREVFEVSSH